MGAVYYNTKCPICKGMGKLQIWDKKTNKLIESDICPVCEGKGNLNIKQNLLRKKI